MLTADKGVRRRQVRHNAGYVKDQGAQRDTEIENLWFLRSRYGSGPIKTVFLERQNSKSIPTLSKYTFEKKVPIQKFQNSNFSKFAAFLNFLSFSNFFTFHPSEYR